jgi:hypothetical protein
MTDFQWDDIQADVLATDLSENDKIPSLKQLKTETKVPTKAINALNEQLKNAQTSASDAVQRVISMENDVAEIKRSNSGEAQASMTMPADFQKLLNLQGKNVRSWTHMTRDGVEVDLTKPVNVVNPLTIDDVEQWMPDAIVNVKFTNAAREDSVPIYWNTDSVDLLKDGVVTLQAEYERGYFSSTVYPTCSVNVIVPKYNVVGMVLAQEGNKSGTWVRVDKDFNTVEFNPEHGTWVGMKQVMNDTYGEFTEIPITYVKTETLQSGPYAGKNCWWIADYPADGFHVHPAFIGQDGQPHNLQIASWVASKKNNVPFSEDKGPTGDGYWTRISYNDVHAKGWMADGARPYNIYDQHFLARMMLVEFGTPDVQSQTVDGVAWTNADNRISYHGINDPLGTPTYSVTCWLDGLTTSNGTYQVLAADGSGKMVETSVSCPKVQVWPVNCLVDQVNGIDFGDLFIANSANSTDEDSGSFADCQDLWANGAFGATWATSKSRGAFSLSHTSPVNDNAFRGWRVTRCV